MNSGKRRVHPSSGWGTPARATDPRPAVAVAVELSPGLLLVADPGAWDHSVPSAVSLMSVLLLVVLMAVAARAVARRPTPVG